MQWLPDGWYPKIVAVDIDGTLTDDKKQLSIIAINSLRRLEEHGIPVVLSTGNVRPVAYGLWRFLGLSGPICCENGGVIWHSNWDETVVRASGNEAYDAATWLATQIEDLNAEGIESNKWRESEWCLYPDEDLDAITKAIGRSVWSHLSVVRTGFAIHLMDPVVSKGQGLADMCQRIGWDRDDILCVGDAPNDLSMFEFCHWSVAVGGAFDVVKDAADVQSPLPHGETFGPLVDAIINAKNALG